MNDVASIDPFTGEPVFSAPSTDAATVAEVVGAAAAAQPAWAARTDRGAVLRRFADVVEAEADRLADLLVREVGKRRADAEGEVAWTALSARWYAEHPPAEEIAGGARVLRRPVGVLAAVTPWNVPLITPAWKWLPALVAGNAVVWKPSERATAVAVAAAELLHAAGVPGDVLALVPGGHGTASALAGDERVGALHFTGSEEGGRALAALAAPRFARVALELSGLNPAVVLADADLDHAADCIIACATALAGQKCTATRRVIAESAVAAPLTERLAERIAAIRVGDPRDPATDVGPLIGPDARERADAGVARAVAAGADVVARADAPAGAALFAPVLLAGLAPGDPLRGRELFAPVLSLDVVASPAEAWARANATPYGLSASVHGRDPALLREAAGAIRSGVLAVNRRGDDVALEAPFGGRGRSGNGQAEGGRYAYDAVTDYQAVYED
ncbi:MAG TPA: aldehyde dehydrogenase family protein [Solirubrobacteraceae bacterium]|nr:aldehyde dehydrogenase family protein [Solirubrobacteraceae bacterium]